jgi:hypothetical protein
MIQIHDYADAVTGLILTFRRDYASVLTRLYISNSYVMIRKCMTRPNYGPDRTASELTCEDYM